MLSTRDVLPLFLSGCQAHQGVRGCSTLHTQIQNARAFGRALVFWSLRSLSNNNLTSWENDGNFTTADVAFSEIQLIPLWENIHRIVQRASQERQQEWRPPPRSVHISAAVSVSWVTWKTAERLLAAKKPLKRIRAAQTIYIKFTFPHKRWLSLNNIIKCFLLESVV